MNDTQEVTFDEDLAWCFDAVSDVSRTFAITIDVLDEPMASRICVGYLLCRVADTVEDAGHIPPTIQQALLEEYNDAIAREAESDVTVHEFSEDIAEWIPEDPGEDEDDWAVVANAPRIVRTFENLPAEDREAIREPVRELVGGMATFVDRHAETGGLRIETADELEEYCWYAAGTVGELITNLITRGTDPRQTEVLQKNARSFALLLQLVNVAKDVTDDYHEENNVYLPANWLREQGVEQDAVCEADNVREVTTVIERVTDQAAGYLDDALVYLEALPEHRGNTLAAWAIPYLLAVGTIRELRERPEDVLKQGGVKVPKPEVLTLIAQFDGGVDKSTLAELRQQMERQPLHQH